jgi:D-threo-aldose 1-dehydrogenase
MENEGVHFISMRKKTELALNMELVKSSVTLPSMIVGTSSLGNLYEALPYGQKLQLVAAAVEGSPDVTVFDSAGKYGAGMALEILGQALGELKVPSHQVLISNKLGWRRTPLVGSKPTFERDVWKDVEYDAVQDISYKGILNCFEEGNALLNGYQSQLVSIHDPDEYLDRASSPKDYEKRFEDILEGYSALNELKRAGRVQAIGVGAKDWKVIQKIYEHVPLDWVMIANSMTIYNHPEELFRFMAVLEQDAVEIVNSAVFHSGFLLGGDHFDYRKITEAGDESKFRWRELFFALCGAHDVNPAHACIQFAMQLPGVSSVALNSISPHRLKVNAGYSTTPVPNSFWDACKERGLIAEYLLEFNMRKNA